MEKAFWKPFDRVINNLIMDQLTVSSLQLARILDVPHFFLSFSWGNMLDLPDEWHEKNVFYGRSMFIQGRFDVELKLTFDAVEKIAIQVRKDYGIGGNNPLMFICDN